MKEKLNQVRADLKFYSERVQHELDGSRFNSLAVTSLQSAMMFTGNTLRELNLSESPYKDSSNPDVKTIEPFYDHTGVKLNEIPAQWPGWEQVQRVKWLRGQLELLIEKVKSYSIDLVEYHVEYHADICLDQVFIHATSAKNWLGMELGRIRDAKV